MFEKNKKFGEIATLAAVSVFKILAKLYRSIDIMKRADKVTNKMINEFVKSSYKLIKNQERAYSIREKMIQDLGDAQTASNSGDSKKISDKEILGVSSNLDADADAEGDNLR